MATATTRLNPSQTIPHPTLQTAWASPFLVAEVKGRAKKRLPALSRRHSGIPVRSKSDPTLPLLPLPHPSLPKINGPPGYLKEVAAAAAPRT